MRTLITRTFAVFLVFYLFKSVSCECKQSYMTICDTVQDILNTDNVCRTAKGTTCTDLLIKSNVKLELRPLALENLYLKLCSLNLKSLIIVGQVTGQTVESPCAVPCLTGLEYLSFQGNDMREITTSCLPGLVTLRKLSLVDNNIQFINSQAFSHLEALNMDFSNNKIEIIESKTFSKNGTKVIVLKNNKINFVEPGSFPSSLEVLDLSNNQLTQIQDGVTDYLVNLRELLLTNNQLYKVPNIKEMKQLRGLSLSYNNIRIIDDKMFQKLQFLRMVDLSHNKIKNVEPFLILFANRPFFWGMSLAYNLLEGIRDETLKKFRFSEGMLVLFGNPWRCEKWKIIENFMKRAKIEHNYCDMTLFNSGEFPHCVATNVGPIEEIEEKFFQLIDNEDIRTRCELDVHNDLNQIAHEGESYMCLG